MAFVVSLQNIPKICDTFEKKINYKWNMTKLFCFASSFENADLFSYYIMPPICAPLTLIETEMRFYKFFHVFWGIFVDIFWFVDFNWHSNWVKLVHEALN